MFESVLFVIRVLNVVVIVKRIRDTCPPFYRPPLPKEESESVHPAIITLMKQCWAEEPAERPSFNAVAKTLKIVNEGRPVLLFIVLHSCNILLFRSFTVIVFRFKHSRVCIKWSVVLSRLTCPV